MTKKQWGRLYLVMLLFVVGIMVAGCVAVISIGNENNIKSGDIEGTVKATANNKPRGLR